MNAERTQLKHPKITRPTQCGRQNKLLKICMLASFLGLPLPALAQITVEKGTTGERLQNILANAAFDPVPVVNISGDNTFDLSELDIFTIPESVTLNIVGGSDIWLPSKFVVEGKLNMNNASLIPVSDDNDVEIRGSVELIDSTINGRTVDVLGDLSYGGKSNILVGNQINRGVSGSETAKRGGINVTMGSVKPIDGDASISIDVGGGNDVTITESGEVVLSKKSHLDVGVINEDGERSNIDIGGGGRLETESSNVEGEEARVTLRDACLNVNAGGALDVQDAVVELKRDQDPLFGSEIVIAQEGEAKFRNSVVNGEEKSRFRISGMMEYDGSVLSATDDSELVLEPDASLNTLNDSLVFMSQSRAMIRGFFIIDNSAIFTREDTQIIVGPAGLMSHSTGPIEETGPIEDKGPFADAQRSLQERIDRGLSERYASERERAQIEALRSRNVAIAESVGSNQLNVENTGAGADTAKFSKTQITIEGREDSTLTANSIRRRQDELPGGMVFFDSVAFLMEGSQLVNRGSLSVNGILGISEDSSLINHTALQMGGFEFFDPFPKTIAVLGTVENLGDWRNAGGQVDFYEGSVFQGNVVEVSDGGTVSEDLALSPLPMEPEVPAEPPVPTLPVEGRVTITSRDQSTITLAWTDGFVLGVSNRIEGPYEVIADAVSPLRVAAESEQRFFRALAPGQ